MNEVLVYYLTRPQTTAKGVLVNPFMGLGPGRLIDADGDGFMEFLDPWGGLYLYAENASHKKPTGMNPASFDLVSPGPDGVLGGTITPASGYVPATTPGGITAGADDILVTPPPGPPPAPAPAPLSTGPGNAKQK